MILATVEIYEDHRRAMVLCKEENKSCVWPEVPEKYCERAVEEMIKA